MRHQDHQPLPAPVVEGGGEVLVAVAVDVGDLEFEPVAEGIIGGEAEAQPGLLGARPDGAVDEHPGARLAVDGDHVGDAVRLDVDHGEIEGVRGGVEDDRAREGAVPLPRVDQGRVVAAALERQQIRPIVAGHVDQIEAMGSPSPLVGGRSLVGRRVVGRARDALGASGFRLRRLDPLERAAADAGGVGVPALAKLPERLG